MSIDPAAITALRQAVGLTMSDTVKITRKSDDPPVFDPDTGGSVDAAAEVLYASQACRIGPWGLGDRVVQAGEQAVTLRVYNVTLPTEVDDLEINDRLEVLSSNDSYLVGKNLRVEDVKGVFHGVQRRLTAEMTLG